MMMFQFPILVTWLLCAQVVLASSLQIPAHFTKQWQLLPPISAQRLQWIPRQLQQPVRRTMTMERNPMGCVWRHPDRWGWMQRQLDSWQARCQQLKVTLVDDAPHRLTYWLATAHCEQAPDQHQLVTVLKGEQDFHILTWTYQDRSLPSDERQHLEYMAEQMHLVPSRYASVVHMIKALA